MSQELVVVQPEAQVAAQPGLLSLVSSMFKSIDFNALNQAIDRLGNHSGNLTPEEKEAGVQIVERWNRDVSSALFQRQQDIYRTISFFEQNYGDRFPGDYLNMLEEIGPELAQRTGTVAEYEAYMLAIREYKIHQRQRPEQPEIDEDLPRVAKLKVQQAYELERTKWEVKSKKLTRNLREAERTWKKRLQDNPDVEALIRALNKQVKVLNRASMEASEKAQLAKLNILIGDADVRQSLREMIDFTKNL